jgi:hypothetical protein
MVDAAVTDGSLTLTVRGLHVFWALKRRFEIPLGHIRKVYRADPEIARGWWKGIRAPGTFLPGVIIAGTYYTGGERVFWDVSDATKAIVIELTGEAYARLIVEVSDPEATIALIRDAMVPPGF